ncbi:DinB family protein [Solitalea koreensis]|uniref:DinB superfamily protein n=1 Tax=Solitalea koreensis TaxID=543615 RepID=A0A521D805_9SPHI|nr:DinB family protein [Solitalea koreensis]SMO67823.1 DinB superfamily protein [Solitalea koreensis]
MKKIILLAVVTFLTSFTLQEKTLNETERKFLVDYLTKTRDHLMNDLKGLSPEQLNFKADTSRWSIKQCVEHIALAENALGEMAQQGMKDAANPDMRKDIKVTDEQIITMITDRSKKFKAPEFLQPTGAKLPTEQDAVKAFLDRRNDHIKYISSTKDDLRDHVIDHPAIGKIDTYQAILFMAAHSARHTLQIEEVMANPNFPKR